MLQTKKLMQQASKQKMWIDTVIFFMLRWFCVSSSHHSFVAEAQG
jgi:hypothetical protein